MTWEFWFVVCSFIFSWSDVSGQNFTSPCPRLFEYERKNIEKDRYFGNVRVETMEELNGVWLKMIFDQPCIQLGNWLGEVTTEDNKEFLIKKPKLILKPGNFLTVRFYVKFNSAREIPQLTSIRLNSKLVCPENPQEFPKIPEVTNFEVLLADRNGNETAVTEVAVTTSTTSRTPPSPYNLIEEIELPGPTASYAGVRPSYPGVTPSYIGVTTTEDYGEFFQGDLSLVNYRVRSSECGIVKPPNHHTYGYEEPVYEGAFPWHAAIYLSKGTELSYICAANLISSKFLLTVAHCVTKRNSEVVVRPEHLLIYLGKYYLRRWSNPAIQERQVQSIYIHDQYNHATISNDIALLKLMKPVKFTEYVRPVCLWRSESTIDKSVGDSGIVVGWGFNENGIVTNKLVKAYMPLVHRDICINNYPGFYKHFISHKSYCASFANYTEICNGDSGGGMVLPTIHPGVRQPTYYLRGVISLSVALQNEFKCDNEHFAIFTDVSKYLSWIDKFSIN